MRVYKIRRKPDGLYSNGGTSPRFTDRGKLWLRESDVKKHLNHFVDFERIAKFNSLDPHPGYQRFRTRGKFVLSDEAHGIYGDCEIVEFVLQEAWSKDVLPFAEEYAEARTERRDKVQEAAEDDYIKRMERMMGSAIKK